MLLGHRSDLPAGEPGKPFKADDEAAAPRFGALMMPGPIDHARDMPWGTCRLGLVSLGMCDRTKRDAVYPSHLANAGTPSGGQRAIRGDREEEP
jgi:hypothetical protein